MKAPLRFSIRTPAGVEPLPRHPSPEAVLSRALTLACRAEAPGVWEVVEYEDVVYRVHRTAERSCIVETAR